MRIIGRDDECRLIGFSVKSIDIKFQNVTFDGRTHPYIPFTTDAEIVFKDTREIDHLIYMLTELKRYADNCLGEFERV